MKRDLRRNLQTRPPGIQGLEQVDQNGWPVPLNDPSDPLSMKVTNGSNGEQKNIQAMSTSSKGELSLTEGREATSGGGDTPQGGHSNKLKTSQQNDEDHSTPESERSQ